MNAKQAKFVEEYGKDENATQAAIRCGYSAKTAGAQGFRLLQNAEIKAAIEAARKEVTRSVKLTKKRVLQELKALAMSCITDYVIDDLGNVTLAEGAPPNAMAAISSIEKTTKVDDEGNRTYSVKLKFWDKPGTLKLAGRHVDVKGFSDRTEITGKNGGPIMVAPMTAEEAAREIAAIEAEARGEDKTIDAAVACGRCGGPVEFEVPCPKCGADETKKEPM